MSSDRYVVLFSSNKDGHTFTLDWKTRHSNPRGSKRIFIAEDDEDLSVFKFSESIYGLVCLLIGKTRFKGEVSLIETDSMEEKYNFKF